MLLLAGDFAGKTTNTIPRIYKYGIFHYRYSSCSDG
jgi:hypothetical protein